MNYGPDGTLDGHIFTCKTWQSPAVASPASRSLFVLSHSTQVSQDWFTGFTSMVLLCRYQSHEGRVKSAMLYRL